MTDVEMPEMDGLELDRVDPRDARAALSLPVVIVTSRDARGGPPERGIEAGADAYMVKREFDQQKLLGTIERLIGS